VRYYVGTHVPSKGVRVYEDVVRSRGRRMLQLFHLADDLHPDVMVVAYPSRE